MVEALGTSVEANMLHMESVFSSSNSRCEMLTERLNRLPDSMDDATKALMEVRAFEMRVSTCEQYTGGFKAQMEELQMSVSECCEEVLAQNENLANQRASQHSSAFRDRAGGRAEGRCDGAGPGR